MLGLDDGIFGEHKAPPGVVVSSRSIVNMHLQSFREPRCNVMVANVGPGGVCLQQTNDINICKATNISQYVLRQMALAIEIDVATTILENGGPAVLVMELPMY